MDIKQFSFPLRLLSIILCCIFLFVIFAPRSHAIAVTSAVAAGAVIASVASYAGIKLATSGFSGSDFLTYLGNQYSEWKQNSSYDFLTSLGVYSDNINSYFKINSSSASDVTSFLSDYVTDYSLSDSSHSFSGNFYYSDVILTSYPCSSSDSSLSPYLNNCYQLSPTVEKGYSSLSYQFNDHISFFQSGTTISCYYDDTLLYSSSVSLVSSTHYYYVDSYLCLATCNGMSFPLVGLKVTEFSSSTKPTSDYWGHRCFTNPFYIYSDLSQYFSVPSYSASLSSDYSLPSVPTDDYLYIAPSGVSGNITTVDDLASSVAGLYDGADGISELSVTGTIAATDTAVSGGGGSSSSDLTFPLSSFSSIWQYVLHMISQASSFFVFIGDLLTCIPQVVRYSFFGFFVLLLFAGLTKKLLK